MQLMESFIEALFVIFKYFFTFAKLYLYFFV